MKKVIILGSLFFVSGLFAEKILETKKKTEYISALNVVVQFEKLDNVQTEKTEEVAAKEEAIRAALNELDEKAKTLFALLEECKNSGDCEVLDGESRLLSGDVTETVSVDRTTGLGAFLFGDGKRTKIEVMYPKRVVRNILNPGENRPKSEK